MKVSFDVTEWSSRQGLGAGTSRVGALWRESGRGTCSFLQGAIPFPRGCVSSRDAAGLFAALLWRGAFTCERFPSRHRWGTGGGPKVTYFSLTCELSWNDCAGREAWRRSSLPEAPFSTLHMDATQTRGEPSGLWFQGSPAWGAVRVPCFLSQQTIPGWGKLPQRTALWILVASEFQKAPPTPSSPLPPVNSEKVWGLPLHPGAPWLSHTISHSHLFHLVPK